MKIHPLIIFTVLLVVILAISPRLLYSPDALEADNNKTVYIEKTDAGFQLIRNGKPFYIKGAGGNMHLDYLAQIGGNTIRLYDTLDVRQYLDEAHRNNLAVIIDIPLPQYDKTYNLYRNEEENRLLRQKIKILINRHKNHPALLMWNLGNEINYPFTIRKNEFIETFNSLIDIIKEEDPNHPVSTAIEGLGRRTAASIFIHSPQLDLLACNIFGDTPNLNTRLKMVFMLFGVRPYYISEFGTSGSWESAKTAWNAPIEETSTKKTEQISQRYSIINENKSGGCLGSLAFYWGNKLEKTHTWFSYFIDDYKSEVILGLEALWSDREPFYSPFNIKSITIKDKTYPENFVFEPGNLKVSEVELDQPNVNLRVNWEIYEEAWPLDWALTQDSSLKINELKPIESFVSFDNYSATFITPEKEGPYRLFVFVYDQNGFFGSANVPFYILARE